MRRKHTYGIAFLAVLVAAAAGFFLARRAIGPIELPEVDAVAQIQSVLGDVDVNALIPRRTPQARETAVATEAATGEPEGIIVEPGATGTAAAEENAVAPGDTVEPGAGTSAPVELAADTATPEPTATFTPAPPASTPTIPPVDAGILFMTAGPVRNGNDNCPGASIRGVVRDASGTPLSGIRLWRYDQWGNEQVVESKSAEIDAGQYDFPLGDTPNVHYVQIIDAGGVIISPVVEIQHRQGDAPDAGCHWLDWVKR